MDELILYRNELKEMKLYPILKELEQQARDSEYHRLCSKNEKLENICNNKILLIQCQILDIVRVI